MSARADWNELEVGDEIEAFVRTTDLAHWNRYAAVNDEFIPIHMDPADAQAVGQPDVFGMGNLRLAYLHNVLYDWLAGRGAIVELSCQFRGFNFKGDRLAAKGTVTAKEERDGAKLALLEIGVFNQRDENTTPGSATLLLFDSDKGHTLAAPAATAAPEKPEPGVYLDAETIGWLGRATNPVVALPVGANDIRRWAIATYYPARPPLEYYDEKLAEKGPWGGLVAPPDFNPFAWMLDLPSSAPWLRGMGTEPGTRVLNGGQHSRYFAPIRPGDVITSQASLANAYEREGKLGTMLFLINETHWTNQHGELVRIGSGTIIYY